MNINLGTQKFSDKLAEKFLEFANRPKFVLIVWLLLFAMTVYFSELSIRSLISAFIAWTGGLLTAHLNYVLRRERIYKDVATKIQRNRKYNKNVY